MNQLHLISRELNNYQRKLTKPEKHWPYDIQNGLICLNSNIFKLDYSVKRMKENCKISGRNFSSRFRNFVGMTSRKYITFHRTEVAKIMLEEKSLNGVPVNTIGFSVGYENPAAFSMVFKNTTGISPARWRI